MDLVASVRSSLHRLFAQPVAELSRAQRLLRYGLDLTRHCALERTVELIAPWVERVRGAAA